MGKKAKMTSPYEDPPQKAAVDDAGFASPFPEAVVLPLEDVLDLHPFAPAEIRSVVEEYLLQCRTAGLTVVRLIHGKGKGVQRASIHALLARLPFVHAFHEAPTEAGGWGATMVVLSPDLANPEGNR
jgi:dsDNA-specific endonuclease/ATPase MutS2